MSKHKIPVVGFLGENTSFFNKCELIAKVYENSRPLELIHLEPKKLSVQYLKENRIDVLILDMKLDNPNFDKVFNEARFSYFPNKLFIIASSFNLNQKIIERAQQLNFSFIYQYTSQSLDENQFLIETALNCLYPNNLIRREFAIAKLDKDCIIQVPVSVDKICLKEIVLSGNISIPGNSKININHNYLKKLNWSETNLLTLKSEKIEKGFFKWNNFFRTEVIKPEDLDRFEIDFANNFADKLGDDEFKKNQLLKFLNPLLIEKKQNLYSFYKKHRFNVDLTDKAAVLLFTKKNLEFKFKKEEILKNFTLIKKYEVSPSLEAIRRFFPCVIFFELEATPPEMKEADIRFHYNDITTLKYLIETLRDNYINIPIIVFNPGVVESIELNSLFFNKEIFQEASIPFCSDFIHSFLKNKLSNKIETHTVSQLNFNAQKAPEPVIYINDKDSANFGSVEVAAKILLLTENELIFQTEVELPDYCLIKAFNPFEIYFTIIHNEKLSIGNKGKIKKYHGVINGLSSEDRDNLRAFVINFNKAKEEGLG